MFAIVRASSTEVGIRCASSFVSMCRVAPDPHMNVKQSQPFLQMRGIVKRFPGVLALSGVDFDIRLGEVHVLLGENGAGKSTLIKVLSGVYPPDAGEILFGGRPVTIRNPHAVSYTHLTLPTNREV